jgi:peptidoglycan hydrolase CwlO-like protein
MNSNNHNSRFEHNALRFTRWIGSTSSIVTHSIIFIASFIAVWFGADLDKVLLILTTAVSLEAIYLAIFIQMTVNQQSESIQEVGEDIDEIQEDIDEIQVDVDEIQEDVDEIQEDIDVIQEEVSEEEAYDAPKKLDHIHAELLRLVKDIEELKSRSNKV